MLSLFVWVVLVLVYPSFSVSMVDQLTDPVDSRIYSSERAIQQILQTVEDEGRKYLMNDGFEGESEHFNVQGNRNGLHVGLSKGSTATHIKFRAYDWRSIDPESEKRIPLVIRYHQFLTPLKFQAAEKIGLERLPALEQTRFRRARIARNLLRLSPAAMYNLATQAWTGTDLYGVEDFLRRHANIDGRWLIIFTTRMPFQADSGLPVIRAQLMWTICQDLYISVLISGQMLHGHSPICRYFCCSTLRYFWRPSQSSSDRKSNCRLG